jgi:hypothetical protein
MACRVVPPPRPSAFPAILRADAGGVPCLLDDMHASSPAADGTALMGVAGPVAWRGSVPGLLLGARLRGITGSASAHVAVAGLYRRPRPSCWRCPGAGITVRSIARACPAGPSSGARWPASGAGRHTTTWGRGLTGTGDGHACPRRLAVYTRRSVYPMRKLIRAPRPQAKPGGRRAGGGRRQNRHQVRAPASRAGPGARELAAGRRACPLSG